MVGFYADDDARRAGFEHGVACFGPEVNELFNFKECTGRDISVGEEQVLGWAHGGNGFGNEHTSPGAMHFCHARVFYEGDEEALPPVVVLINKILPKMINTSTTNHLNIQIQYFIFFRKFQY